MTIQLTVAISMFCTLLGATLGFLGHKRNAHKDAEENGKTDGMMLTEIGYIKAGVDDIKRQQEKADDRYLQIAERVTAVEASAKQAHYRLNKMEGSE